MKPVLPCFPCPHNSTCCSWGSSLTEPETQSIIHEHGPDHVVWDDEEKEHRTAVKDGVCVFLRDNACSIHGQDYYPSICKGFPYKQGAADKPYEYEVGICPEFSIRSDLEPLFDRATGKLKILP